MKHDGAGELQSAQQQGIEFHDGNPGAGKVYPKEDGHPVR